ncbi:hypothetical protein HYALB_00003030 [Hymenoscyphus albidus]|uniref:Nucleoporin Nup54 alpha-helical domain-containing protein n=1 Tax=Hymenoscyphus albidus TaxID=595503 RepID=A0A9N9LYL0_9HELO|nr:hypothetical protein HYALB_00003030 [Hymenoscyphus albidus]
MSLFGNTGGAQQQGGGLFGGLGQAKPAQTGGLFGGLGASTQQPQQQQQGGGLFGGLGNNTQQQPQQQAPTGGLFGNSTQQQQQQQGGGLFGNLGQNNQQQNQQPQQQAQTGGLFGSLGNVQPGQQPQGSGLFGQQPQNNLGNSLWQPDSGIKSREKSVPEQIGTILSKWDVSSRDCAFQHYFYNKVDDNMVPFYQAGPNEDPKAWDEALSKKPGPGFIPVLCVGFSQLGERIKNQQNNLSSFNRRLHEINNALSLMLQNHDTKTSIRAMDARRKHMVLKQRCLALATKVQVLKNRGYAMGGDEEDLKTKLQALERSISDPGLGARGEEIWARMLTVQERAKLLKAEIEKSGVDSPEGLDEERTRQGKKILEDYQTQLDHMKKELEACHKDYVEWEKENGPPPRKINPRDEKADERDKTAYMRHKMSTNSAVYTAYS